LTGIEDFNLPTFDAVEDLLKKKYGCNVLNPARHPKGLTWTNYMRLALVDLSAASCVCMLYGWGESRGATMERSIARELNIKIVTAREALR
jgi:hypothetical protein